MPSLINDKAFILTFSCWSTNNAKLYFMFYFRFFYSFYATQENIQCAPPPCQLLTSMSSGTLWDFIEASSSIMGTISELRTDMMLKPWRGKEKGKEKWPTWINPSAQWGENKQWFLFAWKFLDFVCVWTRKKNHISKYYKEKNRNWIRVILQLQYSWPHKDKL